MFLFIELSRDNLILKKRLLDEIKKNDSPVKWSGEYIFDAINNLQCICILAIIAQIVFSVIKPYQWVHFIFSLFQFALAFCIFGVHIGFLINPSTKKRKFKTYATFILSITAFISIFCLESKFEDTIRKLYHFLQKRNKKIKKRRMIRQKSGPKQNTFLIPSTIYNFSNHCSNCFRAN